MRRAVGAASVLTVAVVAAAWLSGGLGVPDDALPVAAPSPTVAACQEDEPCWDCETMGNKVCGPTSDAAFPVPMDWPAWMAEAEDDWWAGQDTPRLAAIHGAVEYVTQERLRWERVTQEIGDALAEGSDKPWTYPWEDCVIAYGDTTVVVCEDGTVVTS